MVSSTASSVPPVPSSLMMSALCMPRWCELHTSWTAKYDAGPYAVFASASEPSGARQVHACLPSTAVAVLCLLWTGAGGTGTVGRTSECALQQRPARTQNLCRRGNVVHHQILGGVFGMTFRASWKEQDLLGSIARPEECSSRFFHALSRSLRTCLGVVYSPHSHPLLAMRALVEDRGTSLARSVGTRPHPCKACKDKEPGRKAASGCSDLQVTWTW